MNADNIPAPDAVESLLELLDRFQPVEEEFGDIGDPAPSPVDL